MCYISWDLEISGKISDMTSDHRYFAWLKDILFDIPHRMACQNGR